MKNLWSTLETLKSCHWEELSHPLDNASPYWSGIPEGSVALGSVVIPYASDWNFQIQTFKFPGQFGTHIDFPAHFCREGKTAANFGIKDLVLPLVVLDISQKVAADPEYSLTLADIAEHEARHGVIPVGSFVALRSDWYKRWPDARAMGNLDEEGGEHCPGWTLETIRYLYEVRGVAATGHETLDTDSSAAANAAGDLAVERWLLEQGHFQVEVLANLDKVPPTGALIFIAPARIQEANGLPVRAWAVFED